jgi:hypothetical protein
MNHAHFPWRPLQPSIWALSVAILLLSGCGTTEQQVKAIVRDAEVEGPVFSPPVHVVSDNSRHSATVSTYATIQGMSLLRGVVQGSEPGKSGWLYPVDTLNGSGGTVSLRRQIPQYNLHWQHPEFVAGMHVDLAGGSTALSLGASIAASGGSTLVGWSAGIGLFSKESSSVRLRLDAGVFGQLLKYESRTVAITTTTTSFLFGGTSTTVDTAFYCDRNSESSIGYYGSLTFNSANPGWPVNIFFQANCVVQPILSYSPSTRTTFGWLLLIPVPTSGQRTDVSSNAVFIGITPGIYIEPSPSMVVTAGVRCLYDVSETFSDKNALFIPFVQVGLRVGM